MPEKNKKVLIVEDEVALLEVLVDKFNSEPGFEVLTAKNGEEGLKLALSKKPDLILLDIIMPVMDGMTMMQQLQKEEEGKKIPIIVLTNLGAAEDAEQAVKEGAYDFLIKAEWKLDDVVGKVKKTLKMN